MHRLLNGILFYAAWFVILHFATTQRPLYAAATGFAATGLHLAIIAIHRSKELSLICILTILGFTLDSLLQGIGLLRFSTPGLFYPLAPAWIASLHSLFATSMYSSLSWLRPRPRIGALFFAWGGPFSYHVGSALGAVSYPKGATAALATLALIWGIYYLSIIRLMNKIDTRYDIPATKETDHGNHEHEELDEPTTRRTQKPSNQPAHSDRDA